MTLERTWVSHRHQWWWHESLSRSWCRCPGKERSGHLQVSPLIVMVLSSWSEPSIRLQRSCFSYLISRMAEGSRSFLIVLSVARDTVANESSRVHSSFLRLVCHFFMKSKYRTKRKLDQSPLNNSQCCFRAWVLWAINRLVAQKM